ncbi:MAG: hypothetical protein QM778_29695 [Myxococcales bacterium]
MVHSTRILLSCCGVLAVLNVGCGDSGPSGATSASEMSKPDGHQHGGGDAATNQETPSDAGSTPSHSFREACLAACHAQSACLGFSDSDCMDSCEAQAQAQASSCQPAATAEQDCLAGLTCEQAKAYGTQGRRQHAQCGAQARAYFAACTLDGGSTPAACSALCARYDACGASMVSVPACEEKCILQVSSYHATSGGCGDAFLTFIGCGAQASCGEVKDLAATSTSPAACDEKLTAMEKACQ